MRALRSSSELERSINTLAAIEQAATGIIDAVRTVRDACSVPVREAAQRSALDYYGALQAAFTDALPKESTR